MGAGMFESYGDSIGAWGELAAGAIGAGERDKQRKAALDELRRQYGDISGYEQGYVPEEVVNLGPSAMGGVKADEGLRQNQLQALRHLQAASEEGYTDQDRAAVANLMSEVGQQERGNRMALQQRMDPNSGAALAAQMSNQQASAQRANLGGLNLAANSRAQALRALSQYGDMASGMRTQDFGEQADRARAADAVSKFNAANRQDVYGRNMDRSVHRQDTALNARMGLGRAVAGQHNQQGEDVYGDWTRGGQKFRDASRTGGRGGDMTMAAYLQGAGGG